MDGRLALLQEVPLVYVDKDAESVVLVKSKFQQTPPYTPPQRVENLAGGCIVRKASFVSFRAIGKQVFLWEHTAGDSVAAAPVTTAPSPPSTSLAIQLPESVARNGVSVFESADKQYLSVCIVTAAKTVHRFCYKLDPVLNFADAARDEVAFAMTSLPLQTSISSVCWLDECNVVVGGDNGAVLAINVGLSIFGHSASSFHEVPLTDHSVLQWVWEGLGFQPTNKTQPVIAIAAVPDLVDDDSTSSDTLIVTLSADLVLRVWSYEHQSCLCNQSLRPHLELDAAADLAVLHFVPSSTDVRVLVHASSVTHPSKNEIVLLRGDLTSKVLDLDIVRRYVVPAAAAVRLVDFVVVGPPASSTSSQQLVSVWRSVAEDFVYVFPISRTGPKVILGQRVKGLDTFVHHHESHDLDLNNASTADVADIDSYYLDRLFAPNRFSAECIRHALSAASTAVSGAALRRLALEAVHRECQDKARREKQTDANTVRVAVWLQLLRKCTKLWAVENIPLGVASIQGSLVLLRRNHTSILFPSTRAIVATSGSSSSSLPDDELSALITPFFASFSHRDVRAAVLCEWNVDLHVDLTSPSLLDTLRRELQRGLVHTNQHQGKSLPTLLARVAPILAGDATAQSAVLTALVENLALLDASSSASPSATAAPPSSTDLSLALHRMGAVVVHDMLAATYAALGFLAFLDDAQPSFVAPATLQQISTALLPRGLALLRKWVFYQWLFDQPSSPDTPAMLVQAFARHDNDNDDDVQRNLATAVLGLLHKVHDLPALASYVHATRQHDVVRVVVRYALQHPTDDDGAVTMYLTRLLGDALVAEAVVAYELNHERRHVTHILARAVRSYITVLELEHRSTTTTAATSQLYEITGHLKETAPRPYAAKFILQLLHASLVFHCSDDVTGATEFIWYNVFKLALTERLYDEAHVALHHVVARANSATVDECVRHFVLQLCDAGRVDVIVGFTWGALDAKVEDVLQWQAANTHANLTIKRASQSAVSVLRLLYSFLVKRARFAAAAQAMHALFVRLEPDAFHVDVLRVQRDALLAATNVLALVPAPQNRWFLHQEAKTINPTTDPLRVVTASDLRRELLIVRGKLKLVGSSAAALAGQSGSEVVSLLLKHLTPDGTMATNVSLAVAIARAIDMDVKVVVRAVARDFAYSSGTESLLQALLRHTHSPDAYLAAVDTLLQSHAPLPTWLTDAAVAAGPLTAVALLRLYLDHGVLDEAVALAIDHLVPKDLSQTAFHQAAAADTSPKHWMPYELLDKLLGACDTVGGDDVAPLQHNATRLKQRLAEYFQYVHVVDAAASIRRQHERRPTFAPASSTSSTPMTWSTN
ncbi:hypothetical protein DYB37_004436 [Aphanomyces astaci]|uniref:Uncharacterized protein n=1 Tax=Aphanomyces astaci TaxID=112090 RepID=A0A3R6X7C4_APHAT|nr:hypothetical protein DYB35_001553 [Aphanomyces astaci]RHZ17894.1 hypothetical protein DYB37_004436 [Aphanomyces astaci]